MDNIDQNQENYAAKNGQTKLELVNKMARALKKEKLDYNQLSYVLSQVRKKLGVKKMKQPAKLPRILSKTELEQFFKVVEASGHIKHELMLQLLYFCFLRCSELTNLEIKDILWDELKFHLRSCKGNKDRYVLFPEKLKLSLKAYIQGHPSNKYLFETNRGDKFSVRRIEQIVKEYGKRAGIERPVFPHLFRHCGISALSGSMTNPEIQVLSGHASQRSLNIYQHISLENLQEKYQKTVGNIKI